MITTYFEKYPDLSKEAILKTDLLRVGVHFTDEALEITASFKPKSYFIFSFDRVAQKDLSQAQKHSAPEEIRLSGGLWDLQNTIVSVRLNPQSEYRVDVSRDLTSKTRLSLFVNDQECAEIDLANTPDYYEKKLATGKPVIDIAPTIEWGYLIYLTAFRLCQYWGDKEECQFCDINANYRQQRQEGRSYTGIKSIEETLDALQIIHDNDNGHTNAYTVTGGAILTELQGQNEAEFYAQYAEAIEAKFPGRWIGKAVVQALPADQVQTLKNAGYQIYHPNYEVWEEKLFNQLCPGKARFVGHGEWMKRILDSAEIFGPQNVIPNFVAGIEMAKPYGYAKPEEAVASTSVGLDYFMSRGVVPRFTVWCLEPNTALTPFNSEVVPLDYHLQLLRVYRDTHQKYKLPVPPGYGEAGRGKAVFSVSAFMDVLG